MKKFFVGLVIDAVFDALIKSLRTLARKSSSKVDDKLVDVIVASRADLISEIKERV